MTIAKGRIYLPLEDLRRYGVSEDDIAAARNTPAFRDMMRFEVERARQWFERGLPLVEQVDRELAVDIELFSRGGQEILNAIERQGSCRAGPASRRFRRPANWRWWPGPRWGSCWGPGMSAAVQPMPSPFSPTSSQIAVAYSVCRSITRAAAKNFYYAFLVLPQAKRQALCAVYAFMRRCDDIADDFKQPSYERRQRLEAWLDAFHRAESGHPTDDPVLLALTDTQRRFKVPVELLDQLAYGTGMDIQDSADPVASRTRPQVLYRTFGDLRLYCYRVASVVGSGLHSDIWLSAIPLPKGWRKISDWLFSSPTSSATLRKTPAWAGSIFPPKISTASGLRLRVSLRRRFRSGCAGCSRPKPTGPANTTAPPTSSCLSSTRTASPRSGCW